ncbi:MAG TPA: molybdopterin-dependent oxidoreductase [Burkholderiaceae bacterium]|nr:molybdopterin-dependent oxidoreductase [Burkholderiaceae bacterium]
MTRYTSSHWGIHEIAEGPDGMALRPFRGDPNPSAIGAAMLRDCTSAQRVRRPAVRRSWLEGGLRTRPQSRGIDPFVEVDWDTALNMTAGAIRRTLSTRGNEGLFGGSYGWASAGRFHHAQSQIHRFLNCIGGYVRSVDTYSLGAARVLMPHIVAPMDELMQQHTSWDVLQRHCQLFVSFGGVPEKNAQINPGGIGEHQVAGGLAAMARAGVAFVNISPIASDLQTGGPVRWMAIRPHTDTALMLGLAHTLFVNGWHDTEFLQRCCVGFDRFARYLAGDADGCPKDARWAQNITGIAASEIEALAARMHRSRTMINVAWSLQRAHHGEQPFWMAVTLAAMLGQIGLPGGGFGVAYGASGMMGNRDVRFGGPTLPQGRNPVRAFIPVARIADMIERPGEPFRYDGGLHRYPSVDLIYWAGGNPFHHHQDLNRLLAAWRRVPAVIVHEQFWTATARMADIVLPVTTTLEREDIGFATRERYMVAMTAAIAPVGEARDDHVVFSGLAERLGVHAAFTAGRSRREWLRWMYEDCRPRAQAAGVRLPPFDSFWADGLIDLGAHRRPVVMLEPFRRDPGAHPLRTPSGRIEIFSQTIDGFDLPDCPGHAQWLAPSEWLGARAAGRLPLHLLSDQPRAKLHSQLDAGELSRAGKIAGREPVTMHPDDAARRGIRMHDLVRIWNDRGACLAAAVLSDRIRSGVVRLSTGAWFDPQQWHGGALEKHGNPNVLTADIGASELSQGCAAQSCLVEIERFIGEAPPVTAFDPPAFEELLR